MIVFALNETIVSFLHNYIIVLEILVFLCCGSWGVLPHKEASSSIPANEVGIANASAAGLPPLPSSIPHKARTLQTVFGSRSRWHSTCTRR